MSKTNVSKAGFYSYKGEHDSKHESVELIFYILLVAVHLIELTNIVIMTFAQILNRSLEKVR